MKNSVFENQTKFKTDPGTSCGGGWTVLTGVKSGLNIAREPSEHPTVNCFPLADQPKALNM